jgi:hypothetical protein
MTDQCHETAPIRWREQFMACFCYTDVQSKGFLLIDRFCEMKAGFFAAGNP